MRSWRELSKLPHSIEHSQSNTFNRLRNTLENPLVKLGVIGSIGIAALTGCSQAEATPKTTQSTSIEATPTKTETATPEVDAIPTVESLELSATLSPTELGTTFIQRLSDWNMSGANETNYKAWLATDGVTSGEELVTNIAEANGQIYSRALFDEAGQSAETEFIQNKIKAVSEAILLNFQTRSSNPLDKEPFKDWYTVDAVRTTNQTDGTITESIDFTQHNNASLNRAATLAGEKFVSDDGFKETINATFTKTDDIEQVTQFSVVERQ